MEKSEPSSWAGEDAEQAMLQNGRQFLNVIPQRLNVSHHGPGRPPSQERAEEKQNLHGRPAVPATRTPSAGSGQTRPAVERPPE